MGISKEFQMLIEEDQKSQEEFSGSKERLNKLCEAVVFVEKRDGILQKPVADGLVRVNRIQEHKADHLAWKRRFQIVGVKDENIVEFRLTGLPENMREFEGRYAITADGVTEQQYKAIVDSQVDYTAEELDRAGSVERAVLRKIRGAYEMLQEVQELVDKHDIVLTKCSSILHEALAWQDRFDGSFMTEAPLTQALMALDAVGGELYAERETPFFRKGEEPTDKERERYFELQSEYRALWVDEGHICTCHQHDDPEKAAA